MDRPLNPDALHTKKELEDLLLTLKNNRERVPLHILKSKYKTGYENLCKKIGLTATKYTKQIILYGIRIQKDYLDEVVCVVNSSIEKSGLLKELSKAAFDRQDINEFTDLVWNLREHILKALDTFYLEHTGFYLTPESVNCPETYSYVNNCILRDGKWIPFETILKAA